MKTTIGGTTIDVDGNAWFRWFLRATPIYHSWGSPGRTRCGLALNAATPLPPRLGIRIGRPCVRCWPELQRQQAIFSDQRRRRREPAGEQLEEAL